MYTVKLNTKEIIKHNAKVPFRKISSLGGHIGNTTHVSTAYMIIEKTEISKTSCKDYVPINQE